MSESNKTDKTTEDEVIEPGSAIVGTGSNGKPDISVALVAAINRQSNYAWTSLSQGDRDSRMKIARAMTNKENGIDRLLNDDGFDVKDVIITKAQWHDDDGTLISVPKCTLISPSGEVITIMAKVWVTEFISIWLMIGQPPFVPSVNVRAKEVRVSGGRRYYTLELP